MTHLTSHVSVFILSPEEQDPPQNLHATQAPPPTPEGRMFSLLLSTHLTSHVFVFIFSPAEQDRPQNLHATQAPPPTPEGRMFPFLF